MIELELNFINESAVVYDDNKVIYHISSDNKKYKTNFTMSFDNDPNKIVLALISIYQPLIPCNIQIKPNRSEYELWLEYKLLRQSEEITKTRNTRKEIEVEDFETIQSRRDDMMTRVRSQIAYLNSVKNKIPKIKKRLGVLWYDYPQPIINSVGSILSIHTITKNIYASISIMGDKMDFYNGFSDFTHTFIESMGLLNKNIIEITNKPMEKRVETSSTRIVKYDVNILENLHRSQLLLYINRNSNIGKSLELNRIQIFDLLSNLNNINDIKMINLNIRAGKDYEIYFKGYNFRITVKQGTKISMRFSCPSIFLKSLTSILPYIERVKITHTFLGTILQVYTDNYLITKVYIPDKNKIFFEILYNKYYFNDPKIEKTQKLLKKYKYLAVGKLEGHRLTLLSLIINGKIGYIPHNNTFYWHDLYPMDVELNFQNAMRLSNLLRSVMTYSKIKYTCVVKGHEIEIKATNEIDAICTCNKRCDYLVAMIGIVLEDKRYE